jgi:multimeric flavodoxin WrbA
MDIYNRLPNDIKKIIDKMIHQMKFSNTLRKIETTIHCEYCYTPYYLMGKIMAYSGIIMCTECYNSTYTRANKKYLHYDDDVISLFRDRILRQYCPFVTFKNYYQFY